MIPPEEQIFQPYRSKRAYQEIAEDIQNSHYGREITIRTKTSLGEVAGRKNSGRTTHYSGGPSHPGDQRLIWIIHGRGGGESLLFFIILPFWGVND